jgi:hypothetical protein
VVVVVLAKPNEHTEGRSEIEEEEELAVRTEEPDAGHSSES